MKRTKAAFLALSIFLSVSPLAARTIKLATLAPEGSPWYEIIRDMAESWEEASGGRIDVRIYPGGVAGDEPDVVRKMRIGQLHAAALTSEGLSYIAPDIRALELPMLNRSYAELDYAKEGIRLKLEAGLEAKGFKVLSWGDAGWGRVFAQRPVVHPDDLKPMRIFVWSRNSAYIEAWKGAGYRPVPLPPTEVHAALQSGLIGAIATTPVAALSFQWFGLAKHMTDLKLKPLMGAMVISTRTWQAIPDDLKPRLLQVASETSARFRETRNLEDEAIEVMKKHGLIVHSVPPEIAAQWERTISATYPKLIGGWAPADMVADVKRLRDEYRASQRAE